MTERIINTCVNST